MTRRDAGVSKPENPSAFPEVPGDFNAYEGRAGMTLRDWFAGQALPAVIAATSAGQHQPRMEEGDEHIRFAIVRDAYDMADAMLAERSKAVGDHHA